MRPHGDPAAIRVRRKVMARLMPLLSLLYVVAYLDRVNVGYAAEGMSADLGFSSSSYGFGAGLFFVGYVAFEVPSALAAARFGITRWIARIMITWGIAASALGLVNQAWQFHVLRFVLGAAEAGFFPAMLLYLGRWFAATDRAKAIAVFMSATTVAMIVGGPLSAALSTIGWGGIAGWRWLLVLEGVPAVALGLALPRLLVEHPLRASWLTPGEKAVLIELTLDGSPSPAQSSPWRALADRRVLAMGGVYFLGLVASNGLNFWLPTMVRSLSGHSPMVVGLVASLPYSLGLVAKLVAGWSSDRRNERRLHTAALLALGGFGLAAAGLRGRADGVGLALTCLGVIGLIGYTPSFWAQTTRLLSGGASAAAIAAVNSLGNVGSFVGPSLVGVVRDATHGFALPILLLGSAAGAATLLVLLVHERPARR